MKKVIILSRVSSEHQDLVQQTEEVLKEVHRDGYTDDQITVIEDKESGIKLSEEERHGLNEMKRLIESDSSYKCVYIYELSRLSRRQLVLFSIRDYLVKKGIQLICMKPSFRLLENDGTMSQTGSLMFSIFSSMSEQEMILKKERMMRGRKHNLSLGKSGGGRPPFGYTTDKDKRWIVDPEESKILKRIFEEYSYTNKSMRTITKELKEEGYFPNTSFFTLQTDINYWIKQEYYTGKGIYPKIISESTFFLSQQSRVKHRIVYKTRYEEKFLLKGGLLIDHITNKYLCGNSTNDGYYSKFGPGGSTVIRQNIDPLVWEESKKIYKKFVSNKEKILNSLKKDYSILMKKKTTIEENINELQSKIDKIEVRFIMGKLSKQKCESLTDILSFEKEEKENRLLEIINEQLFKSNQITQTELSTEVDLDLTSIEERIKIVRQVIKKVTIEKPTRFSLIVRIYTKYSNEILIFKVESMSHKWRRISNVKELENLIKIEKEQNDIRRQKRIERNNRRLICNSLN